MRDAEAPGDPAVVAARAAPRGGQDLGAAERSRECRRRRACNAEEDDLLAAKVAQSSESQNARGRAAAAAGEAPTETKRYARGARRGSGAAVRPRLPRSRRRLRGRHLSKRRAARERFCGRRLACSRRRLRGRRLSKRRARERLRGRRLSKRRAARERFCGRRLACSRRRLRGRRLSKRRARERLRGRRLSKRRAGGPAPRIRSLGGDRGRDPGAAGAIDRRRHRPRVPVEHQRCALLHADRRDGPEGREGRLQRFD